MRPGLPSSSPLNPDLNTVWAHSHEPRLTLEPSAGLTPELRLTLERSGLTPCAWSLPLGSDSPEPKLSLEPSGLTSISPVSPYKPHEPGLTPMSPGSLELWAHSHKPRLTLEPSGLTQRPASPSTTLDSPLPQAHPGRMPVFLPLPTHCGADCRRRLYQYAKEANCQLDPWLLLHKTHVSTQ